MTGQAVIYAYCDRWQNGGVEGYLMNVFRGWDFSVMDICLVTGEKTTDRYDAELARLGVEHKVLLAKRYSSPVKRILANLGRFRTFVRENPCDAIYLNLSNSFTMIYAVYAKHAGIPVRVIHSHCAGIAPGVNRIVKEPAQALGRSWLSNDATALCACSRVAGEWMFSDSARKKMPVQVLPNGIQTEAFVFSEEKRTVLRAKLSVGADFVFGAVGRLVPEKNPEFLLDVLAALLQKSKQWKLVLVGEGPQRTMLEQRANELDVSAHVVFYGATTDVSTVLCALDAFVMPSSFDEGFGIAAIEAQASGLPCLLSDHVPAEAVLLENAERLPLQKEIWKKKLESFAKAMPPRSTEAPMLLRKKGYDIAGMGARIQSILKNEIDK